MQEFKPYRFIPLFFCLFLLFIPFSTINGGPPPNKTNLSKINENSKSQKKGFSGRKITNYVVVRPKVDFLFIWDNSSSFLHNSEATKDALYGTISQISENFDFRIIISPLITQETEREKYLLESWISYKSGENVELNDGLYKRYREVDAGNWAIFNSVPSGTLEAGVSRAYDLTTLGYEKGIFRPSAHMIIVLLSNGDDNSWAKDLGYPSGAAQQTYVKTWGDKFIELKNSQKLQNLKFLSVVPHTDCKAGKKGSTYIKMSAKLSGSQTGDSLDFCYIQSFYNLFNEINEKIGSERPPLY